MKSLLGALWRGRCTWIQAVASLFPSHTSNVCFPFHTQPEGTESGSLEVHLSPWVQRGTGYFALSIFCAWLVHGTASHGTEQRSFRPSDLQILLNVASDSAGLGLVLRVYILN